MALTPQQASDATRAVAKDLQRAIREPMNRLRRLAVKESRKAFRSRAPGAGIFGKRGRVASGRPRLLIGGRSARFSRSNNAFLAEIRLEGMAALIETGGRTEAHRIRPRKKSILKFTRGGDQFSPIVRHPGARVPRARLVFKSLQRNARAFGQDLDKSLQESVVRNGLG